MPKERILVVDDEPEVMRLCTRVLERQGYAVHGLTRGQEALARLEEEPFDLLVVDVKMPDVDGLTVLRQGRSLYPDMTAVVITGYATLNSAIEALNAGARGFVLKPFEIREFTQAVEKALAQRRREQERLRLRAQLPILEIAQALMGEEDVPLLAEHLLNALIEEVGVDQAALMLVDEQTDELYLAGSVGLPARAGESIRIPLSTLPLEEGLVVLEEMGQAAPWPEILERQVLASTIWVPLRTLHRLIGVLHLGRLPHRGPFTRSERNMLSIIGGQIAAALENARLYETLARGKREWETTFDAIVDGISLHDADGRIVRANRALAERLDTTPAALIGRHCDEIVDQLDEPPGSCPCREVLEGGRAQTVELSLSQLGGVFHLAVYPHCDESGATIGTVHVLRDITERKRAERALRHRNEELAALNAIVTAVSQYVDLPETLTAALEKTMAVLDTEGGVIYLREASTRTFSPVASRGISLDVLQEVDGFKFGQGLSGQVAASGEPLVVADLAVDPQNISPASTAAGWHGYAGVPIQSKGRLYGVLVLVSRHKDHFRSDHLDMLGHIGDQIGVAVENVHLAKEASELAILREVDRMRSEFVANVSHELRTPLGLIKIFATTLLRDEIGFDRDLCREFLSNIREESDKLERIVDNLLDMSRLEHGRLELDRQPLDLGQLVGKVIDAMELQLARHRLRSDFPPEPLAAWADPQRIEQVLRNLLENASKYSSAGGTITVRGYRDEQGDQVVVAVTDEGVGIPPEDLERIFERFYRGHGRVTQRVGGVGLGLSVCRGIIEAHGGRIWAESEVGRGSTFSFTLPTPETGPPSREARHEQR